MVSNIDRRPVSIIAMGCSKNLVDAERVAFMLREAGYTPVFDPERPKGIVVINTCGFIGDAKEESINAILETAELKKRGRVSKIIVMGCLSERYRAELPGELPEVDRWYGKFDWTSLVSDLEAGSNDNIAAPATQAHPWERCFQKEKPKPYSAYIKIAEGCNRFCAFCAIPLITGRYRSRTIEDIAEEVTALASRGVREFNIIAQDLSYYGTDIYGRQEIARLIDRLADTDGVEWIRLHYAYPKDFPMDLLDVMARRDNVCKYLDIALQHIDDTVLANMQRHITGDETRALLAEIRRRVPGITLRTTLMVGFPGETEEAFGRLKDFVREQRFERMGAFAYCEEDDTAAARNLTDDIPDEVKQRRLDQLMAIQQDISAEVLASMVGREVKVLIDSRQGNMWTGRTEGDSPEVDIDVNIFTDENRRLRIGQFYTVKITDSDFFSLTAELIDR